jgi:DNA-binding transcriptional MocR family regulator
MYMIEIPLDRESSQALYRQIASHLSLMITHGAFPGGHRLPGARSLARFLGVSRITVEQSYALLESAGMLRIEGRSGAFVIPPSGACASREEFLPHVDMASGLPSPGLVPGGQIGKLCRDLFTASGEDVLLGSPLVGDTGLRHALVRHAATRGIPARWEDVVVVSGAQEGLYLAVATLAAQGVRKIWVESFTYPRIFGLARSLGIGVGLLPMEERILGETLTRVRQGEVLYLIPSFQNPTGRTLSLRLREQVLAAAVERRFWIIEDDAYGELRYGETSVPALKAMAERERILYLGSFSQLLFPGLRLGYVLVPREILSSFCAAKEQISGATSSLVQHLVRGFIEEGHLEESLSAARTLMAQRMRHLAEELRRMLPGWYFEQPMGGIYLWLHTPGVTGSKLAAAARRKGVLVSAGGAFTFPEDDAVEALRLSVSCEGPEGIREAVGILSEIRRSGT